MGETGGEKGPVLNRRTFLKLGAATAIGTIATVGATQLVKAILSASEYAALSPQEKLEANGLKAFIPFYEAGKALRETYRTVPLMSVGADFYWDPFSLVESVSRGRQLEQRLQDRLLLGWGEKMESRVKMAKQKVAGMTIEINSGFSDTEEDVRKELLLYSEIMPAHVIMMPSHVIVLPGGGNYDFYSFDAKGQHDAKIRVSSLANSRDNFYVTLFHEAVHAEANWVEGKPYVDRQAWLELKTLHLQKIKETLDIYASLNWTEARKFKNGDALVLYTGQMDNASLDKGEQRFKEEFGVVLEEMGEIEDERALPAFRYNRLVHAALKNRVRILGLSEEKRTEQDKRFINPVFEPWELISAGVLELDHYFVGPVQRKEGGLPSAIHPPADRTSIITKANMDIQMARMRAFSVFSSDDLRDFNSMVAALRKSLRFSLKN